MNRSCGPIGNVPSEPARNLESNCSSRTPPFRITVLILRRRDWSTLGCTDLTQARRIVGRYTARWHIEEYHKALKSGAGVEDSQLEQAYRLETLIAVLALVALRLLNTKLVASLVRIKHWNQDSWGRRRCGFWPVDLVKLKPGGRRAPIGRRWRDWEDLSDAKVMVRPAGKPSGVAGNVSSG